MNNINSMNNLPTAFDHNGESLELQIKKGTGKIQRFAKKGQYTRAQKIFNEIFSNTNLEPSLITYTVLINSYLSATPPKPQEALQVYKSIDLSKYKLDNGIYNVAIQAFALNENLDEAEVLLKEAYLKYSINSKTYLYLIDALIKKNKIKKLCEIYEKMNKDHLYTERQIFDLLLTIDYDQTNIHIILNAHDHVVRRNRAKFNSSQYQRLLQLCYNNKKFDKILKIYELMKKNAVSINTYTYNLIASAAFAVHEFSLAGSIIKEITHPNMHTHSLVLDVLIAQKNIQEAKEYFLIHFPKENKNLDCIIVDPSHMFSVSLIQLVCHIDQCECPTIDVKFKEYEQNAQIFLFSKLEEIYKTKIKISSSACPSWFQIIKVDTEIAAILDSMDKEDT